MLASYVRSAVPEQAFAYVPPSNAVVAFASWGLTEEA